MTTRSFSDMWSVPVDSRLRRDVESVALVNETVVLRRCALFRDAFKGSAVSYPAELLGLDAPAEWIRRHRVTVDVTSVDELERAMTQGIDATRIVMHPHGRVAAPILRAVIAGAGRFVVSSSQQVGVLASCADRIQRVLVNAIDGGLVSEVLAHRGLDLIGLHCRLDSDDAIGVAKLKAMIAEMSCIRREHGVILSRVSLAGLDVGERCLEPRILRSVAEAIGEVVGDACARHRYPRPALTVSPSRAALLRA